MLLWRAMALVGWMALAALMCLTAELAWSEILAGRGEPSDVERAGQLWPFDAAVPMRLAQLDPPRAQQHLRRALALNPRHTQARIEAALAAENAGDLNGAEQALVESARWDKQFLPAWSLTNFYFRREQRAEFWRWARRAWMVSYGDPTPLFRLCERMTDSPAAVPEVLAPGDPRLLRLYFNYLLEQNDLAGARSLAGRLLDQAADGDQPGLVEYVEREISSGRTAEALLTWNGLISRKLLPFVPLEPGRGRVLTNPDFLDGPNKAFDWRFPAVAGVRVLRWKDDSRTGGNIVELAFSGKQPYECELGWQHLPLAAPLRLLLAFDYRTEGVVNSSGVRWAIQPRLASAVSSVSPALEAASNWRRFQWIFEITETTALGRLLLVYRREPGSLRLEGQIHLRHVRLEPEAGAKREEPETADGHPEP